MKLGICKRKNFYENELFDIDLPRGVWTHCSVAYSSFLKEEDFDFDKEHIIQYLLEHKYSWGTYLPDEILIELKKRVPKDDEWLVGQVDYMIRNQKIKIEDYENF